MIDDVYWFNVESMHRGATVDQTLCDSAPDLFTGQIHPWTLTITEFEKNVTKGDHIPESALFMEVVNKAFIKGMDEAKMLDKIMRVQVHYITNPKVNIHNVLETFHTKSKFIFKNKLESVRPSPANLIAAFGYKFISTITDNAITHDIQCNSLTVKTLTQETAKVAADTLETVNVDEDSAWLFCSILKDKVVKEFVEDPFNVHKKKALVTALSAISKDNKDVTVYGPFYVTYTRMVQEPGTLDQCWFMSGEHCNQLLIAPVVAMYLWSGLKSQTPSAVAGDAELGYDFI